MSETQEPTGNGRDALILCSTCADVVPPKVNLDIVRLWEMLGEARSKAIVDSRGGDFPNHLCALCFLVAYGVANQIVSRDNAAAAA